MPSICLESSHSKYCNEPADECSDDDSNNDTHTPSTNSRQHLPGDDTGYDIKTYHDDNVEETYQLRRPIAHEVARHNLNCGPNCQNICRISTTSIGSI